MKFLVSIIRFFVGTIFIISGLIKLNDPMGFSFKLEEYFGVEVFNLPFLEPFALSLAFVVCLTEIMLGVLLLLGLWKKWTLNLLLAMTIFFGFLTFYSAYFNKVTDCGCFGDAIKFTPWQSFAKDMVLLVLVVFLMIFHKHLCPIFRKSAKIITAISLVACLYFGYYVYNHLPVIDFRPFKVGANIPEGMIYPENAAKPIFDYHWKFQKDGKEFTVTTQGDYPKVEGTFVAVETEEVDKGYVPPIHDFSMEKEGEDFTEELMQEPKLMLVISYDISKSDSEAFSDIKKVTDRALKSGYKVVGLTFTTAEAQKLVDKYHLNFSFYLCDGTTLKTMIRSNPGIIVLDKGTIVQKLHHNDYSKFQP